MVSSNSHTATSVQPTDPRRGHARLAAALATLRGPARVAADGSGRGQEHPISGAPGIPACRDASGENAESLMRSLAGDLHDGAVQELFAASLDLVELVEMADLPDEATTVIERLGQRMDEAARQLRGVMQDMSRGQRQSDDALPAIEAIRERTEAFSASSEINVDVEVRGRGPEPGQPSREALLRFVREGLANVGKHAVASQAIVTVHRGRQWWKVDVDDDGLGDARVVRIAMSRSQDGDYGLSSLAEQARATGGRMWVSAAPRLEGLRVSLTVPVGKDQAPPNGGRISPDAGVADRSQPAHTDTRTTPAWAGRALAS